MKLLAQRYVHLCFPRTSHFMFLSAFSWFIVWKLCCCQNELLCKYIDWRFRLSGTPVFGRTSVLQILLVIATIELQDSWMHEGAPGLAPLELDTAAQITL